LNSKPAGRKTQVVIRGPLVVSAKYVRQHLVNVSALAYLGPLAIPAGLHLTGGGWYDAGSAVSVKAPKEAWFLLPLKFEKWEGNLESEQETVSFTVDSPKRLVAVYRVPPPILGALAALLAAPLLAYLLARHLPKPPKTGEIDKKLEMLEKRKGPAEELRAEAERIMEPMVENVARNINSFYDWLKSQSRYRGEVSGLEVLVQLKEKVEGPLMSLERYFEGVERYEEIMRGRKSWIAELEVKSRGKMSKDDVRRLMEDARLWAVDCRNLHYEWARKRWPPA